jgi:hypothetical protein
MMEEEVMEGGRGGGIDRIALSTVRRLTKNCGLHRGKTVC